MSSTSVELASSYTAESNSKNSIKTLDRYAEKCCPQLIILFTLSSLYVSSVFLLNHIDIKIFLGVLSYILS